MKTMNMVSAALTLVATTLHGDAVRGDNTAPHLLPAPTSLSSTARGPFPLARSAPAAVAPASHDAATIRVVPLGSVRGHTRYQQTVVLPAISTDLIRQLRREDARQHFAQIRRGSRIGVWRSFDQPIAVNSESMPTAQWTVLPDGWRLCSCEVTSHGALGIRVRVESLSLPKGARLAVYDPRNPQPNTPITLESLFGDRETWTETIFSESVVVECQLPPGTNISEVGYTITGVSHLYRLQPGGEEPKVLSCENDVTCHPDWAYQAAGVARVISTVNGTSYAFTGCLLNTVPTSFIDYFLTAYHAVSSQTTASSLNVYWFYQTTNCNGTAPNLSNVPHTGGGADFLAGTDTNDFAFLRLRQASPGGVAYEGWTTAVPSTNEVVACIHHPDQPPVDYKRISFGKKTNSTANFWYVQWDSGSTEEGSSGSPLFNPDQLVIGQDSSGTGQCPPNGITLFGRFDVTYDFISQWLGPPSYRVTDLGTLGGFWSDAWGINDNGEIVGAANITGDAETHAFLYKGSIMTDLGTLGGTYSLAASINTNGQLAGYSWTTGDDASHAFLYSAGTMSDLGTLGGTNSSARSINNKGQVVGSSEISGGSAEHAFLYHDGTMADLGTLGGFYSDANDINDNSRIVGGAETGGGDEHGFLYIAGTMTDLGGLFASEINEAGQVVGGSGGDAFLYSGGTLSHLGTLPGGSGSWALSINESSEIVGQSDSSTGLTPFVYRDGRMADLNKLIPPTSGWNLLEAHAINNKGQIVGIGENPLGEQHGFLLTPVGAPPVSKPAPPILQALAWGNGKITFAWNAAAGQRWQLQYKTNAAQKDWGVLGDLIITTNSTAATTTAVGPDSQRFYRVMLVP